MQVQSVWQVSRVLGATARSKHSFVEKKLSLSFCPVGAHQQAGKAVMISTWYQNSQKKHFAHIENLRWKG